MNTMSLSPVKPPLDTGTHTVPAAATNLTKPAPSLPPGTSNFTPIGLIPETAATGVVPAKPIQTQPSTVAITINSEKSVGLCSKPLPTANGTVFPVNEPAIVPSAVPVANACPSVPPNIVENCEMAQNLTINGFNNPPPMTSRTANLAPPKLVDNVAKSVDIALKTAESGTKPSNDEKKEEAKVEPKKQTTLVKMATSSSPVQQSDTKSLIQTEIVSKEKESAQNETTKKEEKKDVVTITAAPLTTTSTESIPNNVIVSSVKKVSTVTPPDTGKSDKEPAQTSTITSPSLDDKKKAETKAEESTKTVSTPKTTKRKAKEAPPIETASEDSADGRKSKRIRLPTQPYQSPIPELQLIAKLQTPVKTLPKSAVEKIIAFYKNEFLAVRNPEGSFYICQTFQNIYKNSTKIRIRWFTNLPQDVFTPDFYDTTEFDCILTNVTMNRLEKDQWKLPDHERTRIENILKRSLDVEKGVVEQPSVTEEHPDGLDLSLYRDEAQLAQLKKRKKKPASPKKSSPERMKSVAKSPAAAAAKSDKSPVAIASGTKKSARLQESQSKMSAEKTKNVDSTTKLKKDKNEKKSKKRSKAVNKPVAASAAKQSDKNSSKTWEPSVKASNSSRVVLSLKKDEVAKPVEGAESATTKTATKRTSSVSLKAGSNPVQSLPPPTKRRKEEPKPAAMMATPAVPAISATTNAERSGKVRNAGSAVTAKINSAAMRTTKDKASKAASVATTTTTNQRKK